MYLIRYFTGSPGSILPFADTISNIHDISVGQFGSSHNPITVFRFSRQRNTGDLAHDVSLDQPVVVLFAFGGEILSISPPNFTSPNAIVTTNVLNFPDSRACPAPSSEEYMVFVFIKVWQCNSSKIYKDPFVTIILLFM